jgi:hypothetical protein
MDTLLLSHQGSLGQQLQELISQLVKQQVQEQLQLLQKASPLALLPGKQQAAGENDEPKRPCEERLK